ncbi:uncharacterized protein TNIN_325401 [Trichonephila inaurata madagascariensis]|uniref:Uncharacterized protein n=1 Tax=Trichonephila inaurata madagascariensis TaxID=2747483 RepID=A0A8X6YYV7_9ARAC|nr:uncharacterized protein TNIN_325401 [Trichonephila inaurata madagascariensis]
MEGPLLLEFNELDVSINAQQYIQKLEKLHIAIKHKHPGMRSSGSISLYYNARSHIAKVYVEALDREKWVVLEHPPCSLDLSHCDYHIFGQLKKNVFGR